MASVIVKLNEGVSGEGNAAGRPARAAGAGRGRRARRRARAACRAMQLESETIAVRRLPRQVRRARRHRRGADHRRRAPQPERAAAGHARTARSSCCRPTTSCSAGRAGRATSAARSRPTPAYARLITEHARDDRRSGWRARARSAGSRSTSSWSRDAARRLDAVRDRAQPAQGRHDASVPDAAVPDRRPLRRRAPALFLTPRGRREAPRRDRPPRVRRLLRGLTRRRPVRHRRPARAALRPVAPGGRRLPHDQLPHRARPGRADRGRRHARRGRGDATSEAERILLEEARAALQDQPLPQIEATTVDRKGHAGQ